MNRINLAEKLALIDRPWEPGILADLNGQQVKLAKLDGEFVWHAHDNEDEMFLVLAGTVNTGTAGGERTVRDPERI